MPQLALPVFGDEHTNAMLLERCGAGRKLDHATMTDEDVVAAVRDLLEDPSYRQRAQTSPRRSPRSRARRTRPKPWRTWSGRGTVA